MNPPPRRAQSVIPGLIILLSVSPMFEGVVRLVGYLVIAAFLMRMPPPPKRETLPIVVVTSLMLFGVIQDLLPMEGSPLAALGTHIYFLSGLLLGWIAAGRIPVSQYQNAISSWAVAFAILSMLGVAIYTITPGLVGSLPTYTYEGTTHRTIGISNILVLNDSSVVQRNAGIASEPGLFQLVLNLGIASLLGRPRGTISTRQYLQVAFLALAVLTTRSTMGLIILSLLLLVGALRSGRVLLGVLGSVAIGGGFLERELAYQREFKLLGSDAFVSRSSPSREVLEGVGERPFGIGNALYNVGYQEMNWGSFDGYTQIIIRYGLPLVLMVTSLILWRGVRRPLFALAILLTLTSQPIWSAPLVTYFYFYNPEARPASSEKGVRRRRHVVG